MRQRIGQGDLVFCDLHRSPDAGSLSARALYRDLTTLLPIEAPEAIPALIGTQPAQHLGTLEAPAFPFLEPSYRFPLPIQVGSCVARIKRVSDATAYFDRAVSSTGAVESRRAVARYVADFGLDIDVTVEFRFAVSGRPRRIRRIVRIEEVVTDLPFSGDAIFEAWPGFAVLHSNHGGFDADALILEAFAQDVEPLLNSIGVAYGAIADASGLQPITVNRAMMRLASVGFFPPEFADREDEYIARLEASYRSLARSLEVPTNADLESGTEDPADTALGGFRTIWATK